MAKQIDAEIKNLRKIIASEDYFYQIPIYQRPYSWDKDNLSQLVSDLIDAYRNNKDENDSDEQYFCGSIVLVENTNDARYDVIDGQQRLTTFIILFCVLRDFFSEKLEAKAKDYMNLSIKDKYESKKEKLKLLTDEDNQNNFLQEVIKEIKVPDKKKKSKNKYSENALFLKELIDEHFSSVDSDLNDFIEWLFESVVMTKIIVESQDIAIKIFNVLNDRGMPLSSVDILKSNLMSPLSEEEKNTFKREWDFIKNDLENSDLDFYALFILYLYYIKPSNPKHSLHKELLSQFEKDKNTNALKFIYDLKKFAQNYKEILAGKDKYIYCLRYLKHDVYWKSILTSAKYIGYSDYHELARILLAYYYQTWISGGTISRIKQTSFNILTKVKDNEPVENIKKIIKENLDKFNTTSAYRHAIESDSIYGQKYVKEILLMIEYFLEDESKLSFIESNNKIHIEHVLPQTIDERDDWRKKFTSEEIEEYKNSIGNLTLLSGRKNTQAQNYDFEKKKQIYKNSDNVTTSFELTKRISEKSEWTPKVIDERREELVNQLASVIDIFG